MRILTLIGSLILVSGFSLQAFAQEDVCCILSKKADQSAETRALPMSAADCKKGVEGMKICVARKDANNDCPSTTPEDMCKVCGYFWSGKVCMLEDPVAKAKEELKKEQEKAGTPTPAPKK